jgi:simple sugar transport system permease protein
MDVLESAIRLSIPLLFAALGGVLSERVGIVNIALEGMLLAGAFAAMAAASATGNPWLGVLAAAATGLAVGLLHTFLVLRLRVDAIISGVGLNLLSAGVTTFLLRSLYSGGVGVQVHGPASWFPALRSVPLLGTALGASTPFVPLALLAIAAIWFITYRTRAGLQLRAIGEAPRAARAAGVNVDRTRALWLAVGGALTGVGGAYLSLEAAGRFTENLTAGRGYLALAAVIFGRWHPVGAAVAVLCFGLGEAAEIKLQGAQLFGGPIPSALLSALPYVLGLLALAGALGRTTPPAGIGQYD